MTQNHSPWRELSQRYAMCVGQFYAAVAGLGGYRKVGPETVAHWQDIKTLHALCIPIEKEIDRLFGLEERQRGMDAHG
jgi:hypothetical protein